MSTSTKPLVTVAPRQRYNSRLSVVFSKELGDIFRRSNAGWIVVVCALLLVPRAYSLEPFAENMTVHSDFSNLLCTLAAFGPFIFFTIGMKTRPTVLEAVLATATRRWELVVGRLLAFATVWLGVAILVSIAMATAVHTPSVVSWCPFLSYFHPTPMFYLEFISSWTIGGCAVFATVEYMPTLALNELPVVIGCYLVPFMSLFLRFPGADFIAGLLPFASAITGIDAAFAHLPLDPRVHVNFSMVYVGSNLDVWPASIIGASISTAILAALYVRSLGNGTRVSKYLDFLNRTRPL